jgi:hypothetical protein
MQILLGPSCKANQNKISSLCPEYIHAWTSIKKIFRRPRKVTHYTSSLQRAGHKLAGKNVNTYDSHIPLSVQNKAAPSYWFGRDYC